MTEVSMNRTISAFPINLFDCQSYFFCQTIVLRRPHNPDLHHSTAA
jgi:hypothetical protein